MTTQCHRRSRLVSGGRSSSGMHMTISRRFRPSIRMRSIILEMYGATAPPAGVRRRREGQVETPARRDAAGASSTVAVMIEVRDVTKRYGSTLAVDRLTFEVRPGRVTGFLGPNGAGKSTTMRLVLVLDEPDSRAALVAGRPYRRLARPLHHVGAVLDATSVHRGRSAYQHLLLVARSNGIGRGP